MIPKSHATNMVHKAIRMEPDLAKIQFGQQNFKKRNEIHSSKHGLNVNHVGVAGSVSYAKYENDAIKNTMENHEIRN